MGTQSTKEFAFLVPGFQVQVKRERKLLRGGVEDSRLISETGDEREVNPQEDGRAACCSVATIRQTAPLLKNRSGKTQE